MPLWGKKITSKSTSTRNDDGGVKKEIMEKINGKIVIDTVEGSTIRRDGGIKIGRGKSIVGKKVSRVMSVSTSGINANMVSCSNVNVMAMEK